MHINALKTQLMHKNVQMNLEKSQKLTQCSGCSMLTLGKKLKSRRGNAYHFVQKGETFITETIGLVVRSISPNLPQMGQKFYHDMLMPLHDNMPSFMNFRQALDLLESKNQVYISQCLWPSDGGRVFDIHPHFLHGT